MVQNVTSDGTVRVSFVDYGNTEEVPLDNIRQISSSFLKLPFQAIKCWLSGESSYEFFLLQQLLHLETCCFGGRRWWRGILCRTCVLLGLFVCFSSQLLPVLSDLRGLCLLLYWSKGTCFSSASSVVLTGFWLLPC